MQFQDFINQMTPALYETLKQAVAIGWWPNGDALTQQQRESTLQALIAWEHQNVPEEQRTGYLASSCQRNKSKPFDQDGIIPVTALQESDA